MIYDLHCHILPGMDDGAANINEALELLEMQEAQGIEHIVFTPHYYLRKESIDTFLIRRTQAIKQLQSRGVKIGRLGAEVKISSDLLKYDLRPLCMQDTDYILLELPFQHYPADIHIVLNEIEQQGIVPMLAHVDRYPYFHENPMLLYKLATNGIISQINAPSILDRRSRSFCKACLYNGLAHIVVSDCHSVTKRPPLIAQAMALLSEHLQRSITEYAKAVWENDMVYFDVESCPKKGLFGYK